MASYSFCLLFFMFTVINQASAGDLDITDIFEFGSDKGKVTFSKSGDIGGAANDKMTVVPVIVENCRKVTYVRVEVTNAIGPPLVKFDNDMSSIVIKYRPLQYSISKYFVQAKTKKDKNCSKKL